MAILEPSAQPWGQQRTTLTKELTRKLLNCRKKLGCEVKQKHLSRYMQLVANSGYNVCFRMEVLKSGLVGYNRILAADSAGTRPIYRMKQWQASSRWMEKKRRKKNWLGSFWKLCVFFPAMPRSELKKRMQCKEEESRAGGREAWPIKIIEMVSKTLEQTLVKPDPFNGNVCSDKKCLHNSNDDNKLNCRRNCICYKITCLICLKDGKSGDMSSCYNGESEKTRRGRPRW